MIDAFGVGICIACISYLCCICTTTFVACSALKSRKNDIKSCRGYSQPSSSSSRNRSSRVAVQQKQPSSSRAVKKCDSGSESRCPCAEKQQKYFSCCSPCAQQAKRKAYLETSSFLNFEDADLSVASGKCAKVAKGKRPTGGCGLGSNASTCNNNNNNYSFNDFQRFKNY